MAIGTGAALLGSAAAGLAGAAMSGNAAKSAAQTSANAQLESARLAAEASKFRPVGITTNFGQSQFGFNPEGYLSSAGYTLSPQLKAIQDTIMGQAGAYDTARIGQTAEAGLMPGATGLFNLGQQYLATSPEEAARKYLTSQQELLAPERERQLANIRNAGFQTGRSGLAVGGTEAGGTMQSNPEMAAYYNALAQKDKELAAQADLYGQQRTTFGAGLLNTGAGLLGQIPSLTTQGYGPLQTQIGLASSIESLGQQPLDIGAQLGGRSATAGANVGQALLTGGLSAAKTAQAANAYSPFGSFLQGAGSNQQLSQGLSSWFSNLLGGNTDWGMVGSGGPSSMTYEALAPDLAAGVVIP